MLILCVGAKGGLGTTTLAYQLARCAEAVPLDAADGRLAAEPGLPVLDLSTVPQWTARRRSHTLQQILQSRQPLLWTPSCTVWQALVTAFVRDLATLGHVVADGGLAPPPPLATLATLILIVSADTPVARWHEERLKRQWPEARAVVGDLKAAAQALAEQVLGVPVRRSLLERFKDSMNRERGTAPLHPEKPAPARELLITHK